jgi:hypothetical protein
MVYVLSLSKKVISNSREPAHPTTTRMRSSFVSSLTFSLPLSDTVIQLVIKPLCLTGFSSRSVACPCTSLPRTIRRASSAHAEITRGCGGKQYWAIELKSETALIPILSAYLWIQVRCIQIHSVNLLTLDLGVKDMLGTGSEVTAVKIPKYPLGADEWGCKRAIPRIHSLLAFEQEEN